MWVVFHTCVQRYIYIFFPFGLIYKCLYTQVNENTRVKKSCESENAALLQWKIGCIFIFNKATWPRNETIYNNMWHGQNNMTEIDEKCLTIILLRSWLATEWLLFGSRVAETACETRTEARQLHIEKGEEKDRAENLLRLMVSVHFLHGFVQAQCRIWKRLWNQILKLGCMIYYRPSV